MIGLLTKSCDYITRRSGDGGMLNLIAEILIIITLCHSVNEDFGYNSRKLAVLNKFCCSSVVS